MDSNLKDLPESLLKEHLELTERLEEIKKVERCQTGFMDFVKDQWPSFIGGAHHKKMADAFDRIATGKKNGL